MYGMTATIFWPIGVFDADFPPLLVMLTQNDDGGRLKEKIYYLSVLDSCVNFIFFQIT